MLKVSARVKEIDNLVCEFENNTNEMAMDVLNFEKYTNKKEHIACEQIREMLE